ncbi:type II secretion system secretin GspD [Pseudomonas aeruginosa]|uniref:type II secretion system secretin GspD n=1 Tax=Pseudomonas aeruginosa TaxID=287 RepID=UPI00233FE22D|nr:type II secretion system secretin GspD [Pseudomonas aeruginosa]MDC3945717.1 type II secretion system secretin GspD [Pseudomonas aeruginosa]
MPRCSTRSALRLSSLFLLLALVTPGLAATAHPAPAATAAAQEEEQWTINMKEAELGDFIEQVSAISGQTFIVDPRVKGRVTVVSQARLNLAEVYQLFLSVLATHGYAVLPQDGQARIVPNMEGRQDAAGGGVHVGPGSLETRVIQARQTSVVELIPMIRPLVPAHGHLAAVPSANALIVSDRRANIERIESIVRSLDQAGEHDYSIYDLRHAWVAEIAEVLDQSVTPAAGKNAATVQVLADSRSNRLVLLGPPQARARLLRLAQSLDVPSSRSTNSRVIRLRHGDAKTIASTLGEIGESPREGGDQGQRRSGKRGALVRADESLNALVILADPQEVGLFEEIVRQLDVPRAQLLVEAAIVELTGELNEALGVQWAMRGGHAVGGTSFAGSGLSIGTLLGALQSGKPPAELPDGAIVGLGSRDFGALITALTRNSNSNLLSTPSLLTLDNQKAEILVGQNVPFQTGSYTTNNEGSSNPFTTVERKDIGVTLKVTPHIGDDRMLRLEIEQEISSIAPAATLAAKTVDLVTNKRSIKSTVLADDGQVIVLGGLIQDDVVRSDSRVPLLGDIPGVGRLFRSTRDTRVKRNLMVFLRPSIVRDAVGLARLSQGRYRSIQVLRGASTPLFDAAPAIDLRPAAQALPALPESPRGYPEPAPVLMEKPRLADPASLGNGRGGEVLEVRESEPSAAPARRYTVRLIEGSSEAFMRALIERHAGLALHLRREKRDDGEWFAVEQGDFADPRQAQRALAGLPESLPRARARVVARTQERL